MHGAEAPAAACTALCDPASGHLNPINWPTTNNLRSLCASTLNTNAMFHPDLNASGYVPNQCMDPVPTTFPLGSAGTNAVALIGSGIATLNGASATPIAIIGGYFDVSTPNTSCNALQTTCPAQLNEAEIDFADFSLDGHSIQRMRLYLDEQVLTASGVSSSGHFLFTIPQGITFDAVAIVDGALSGLFVSSTMSVDGSIDLTTGQLAFQFDVAGSFDGKMLEASGVALSRTVVDVAPVVMPGPVTMVDSTTSCSASVTLSASAFSEAGLPVTLSYVVDDQFVGRGASVTISLPIGGAHDVSIIAVDSLGLRSTATETVTPTDTLGPVVTTVTSPITLWPPNHEYVTISLDQCVTSVVDQCDGSLSPIAQGQIVDVTSDEPEDAPGSGNTCNDIVIVDHATVRVRAERDGRGDGRVYVIHFTESDLHGNATPATCTVQVPHDPSRIPVVPGAPVVCVGASCGGIPGPKC
jgi:hypothetical protein